MSTINTIGERIKYLMKHLGLTQAQLADQLHVGQANISRLCKGTIAPTDRIVSDICRVFSVSEAWLRDGIGEMFVSRTMNQELAMMANEVMAESDASFRKQCIAFLMSLGPEFWQQAEERFREFNSPKDKHED